MSGRHPGRQRKPSREKIQTIHNSPKTGEYWIFDIAAKATYYPTTAAKFKRTYSRLRDEKRELKTSHAI